jgi:hypothetical protein
MRCAVSQSHVHYCLLHFLLQVQCRHGFRGNSSTFCTEQMQHWRVKKCFMVRESNHTVTPSAPLPAIRTSDLKVLRSNPRSIDEKCSGEVGFAKSNNKTPSNSTRGSRESLLDVQFHHFKFQVDQKRTLCGVLFLFQQVPGPGSRDRTAGSCKIKDSAVKSTRV